jgi:chromate reductase
MPYVPKILAFAGSARTGSFNKSVLRIAVDGARAAGAQVTELDLRDYPLPIFDQDIEAARGLPANARALKRQFVAHDGLLIASPEYNSSFTPLMKNVIDWCSRASEGEKPLAAFQGKVAVLMSASPGALGGLRGLVHLRQVLGNIGVIVLPDQRAISSAQNAIGPDHKLLDAKAQEGVVALGARLAEFLGKLN